MAKKKPTKLENVPRERLDNTKIPYLTGVAMEKASKDGNLKELARLVQHVVESKTKKKYPRS